jgi:hypothetical protein
MIRSVLVGFLFFFVLINVAAAQNCGTYPNTLTNGTNADATQVMGNFTYILPCVRDRLTASRTYYVRTDGNDACNGLTNAAGSSGACAFLTIQKAINTVASLDIGIFNVTISVADGTYNAPLTVRGPWLGSGQVSIVGNVTTPANVILNGGAGAALYVSAGGALTVSGMELRGSSGLVADTNGSINVGAAVRFGTVASYQIYASNNGAINVVSDYSIVGGGIAHMVVDSGGNIKATSLTITITGTPAFTAYIIGGRIGYIAYFLNTFSGTATGPRYSVATGAFLDVNGASTTYLPGNAAGAGTNFGVAPYGLYQ